MFADLEPNMRGIPEPTAVWFGDPCASRSMGGSFIRADGKVRDKRYDNELNIGGNRVLRLTWDDLTSDPSYTIDLVARALGIRRLF
jgi:hypothetical protein